MSPAVVWPSALPDRRVAGRQRRIASPRERLPTRGPLARAELDLSYTLPLFSRRTMAPSSDVSIPPPVGSRWPTRDSFIAAAKLYAANAPEPFSVRLDRVKAPGASSPNSRAGASASPPDRTDHLRPLDRLSHRHLRRILPSAAGGLQQRRLVRRVDRSTSLIAQDRHPAESEPPARRRRPSSQAHARLAARRRGHVGAVSAAAFDRARRDDRSRVARAERPGVV